MADSSNDPIEALNNLVKAQLLDVNTALPGVVVSYANGLARVLPTAKKRFADGDIVDFPIIPNVRVCWPSFAGGAAGIKGPVKAGDRCLLVFSQSAIDESDDRRMFDLQDAYAVMCDLGTAGQGDSGNNDALTVFYGPGHIRISAAGAMVLEAPGGVTINAPTTSVVGDVAMAGDVAHSGGTLLSNGITFAAHKHTGVQAGADTSGGPVA